MMDNAKIPTKREQLEAYKKALHEYIKEVIEPAIQEADSGGNPNVPPPPPQP